MRIDNELSEAGRQYATAHSAHYGTKDLREALKLYRGTIAARPSTQEARYSRSQIRNIVKAVVSKQELLDAQMDLVLAHFDDQSKVGPAPATLLASGLPSEHIGDGTSPSIPWKSL